MTRAGIKFVPATVPAAAGAAAVAGTSGGTGETGMNILGLIFAGVLLAGGGIGVVFMIKGSASKKQSRRRFAVDSAPVPRAAERQDARARASGKRSGSGRRSKDAAQARRKKPRPRPES